MTNEDRIKGHFSAIAECTGNLRRNFDPERVVENDEVVQYLQKQLDTIKRLIGSEPETLLEIGTRIYEEEGEERYCEWFKTLSLEEQKELWIQAINATLEVLDEIAGGSDGNKVPSDAE